MTVFAIVSIALAAVAIIAFAALLCIAAIRASRWWDAYEKSFEHLDAHLDEVPTVLLAQPENDQESHVRATKCERRAS